MEFSQVTITTDKKYADIVSAVLLEYSTGGISVEGEDLLAQLSNWDYIDEELANMPQNNIVKVNGYNIGGIDKLKEELEQLKINNVDFWYEISESLRDDKEYIDAYKQYFKPIEIGALCIVPQWEINNVRTDKNKVIIDPGLAFGTGTHQSTNMCLQMLNTIDCKDKTVLDVGCGSGILGLSAFALGAKKVVMLDNDQTAAEAAKANIKLNDFKGECAVKHGILEDGDISADIITANITADILCAISIDLKKHLNNRGILILSGIIDQKQAKVEDCFTNLGFKIIDQAAMDDWRAYKMTL